MSFDPIAKLARTCALLACLYAATGLAGFAIFVLLFKTMVWQGENILFFRGLLLAALAFALTFGATGLVLQTVRKSGLSWRDAFSAAVLSLSFNICFLVIVPVTIDRSISVFILGEMAAQPQHLFGATEMSDIFTKVYIGDYGQIERRLKEQTVTGNVEKVGDGFRLTSRGQGFIAVSKSVAWLFGAETRLLSPAKTP